MIVKFMQIKQIKKIITNSFLSILGLTFAIYFLPVTAENNNKFQLNLEYLQKRPIDDYILGKGDVLDIKFTSINSLINDEKNSNNLINRFSNFNSYEIDGEGKIYLPKLEDIYVEGLTLYELEELLNQAYKKILKRPEIKLRLKAYRTVQVFIDGEVENPGLYSVPGKTNFKKLANSVKNPVFDSPGPDLQTISTSSGSGTFPDLYSIIKLSGGITPYSDLSNIQVVRNNPISKGGGKIKTNIDFLKVIETGDSTNNIRIMDGDRILLRRTKTNIAKQINKAIRTNLNPLFIAVKIKGRVEEPGNYYVNRSSSLNDAIQVAGNLKVLKGKIKLTSFLPDGGIETKNIRYKANAKRGDFNNPYLKNGDVINVQKGTIIKTSEVVKEVTGPFLGIFSTYTVIDAIFD